MGRQFINDLYYGRVTPWERKKAKKQAVLELERRLEDKRGEFVKQLTERTLQDFENLEELLAARQELERLECFRQGIQIGARFMEEVCQEVGREEDTITLF